MWTALCGLQMKVFYLQILFLSLLLPVGVFAQEIKMREKKFRSYIKIA